jgi:transposase
MAPPGLAMMVQDVLKKSPYCGHMFVFRGKRADRIKNLWWDGAGLCVYAKRNRPWHPSATDAAWPRLPPAPAGSPDPPPSP